MSPPLVRYTLFAHVEDNKGHQEAKPWPDLAAQLADHQRGPKEGPCLTCGTFTTTRGVKTIVQRTAIGLDIEQRAELVDKETGEVRRPAGPLPPPPWDIAAKVRAMGWAGVVYSTHSHSVDAPRCRVILEIEAPFAFPEPSPNNDEETKEAASHQAAREIDVLVIKRIAETLSLQDVLDPSKRGVESLLYLPRYANGTEPWAEIIDGAPLDYKALREVAQAEREQRFKEAAGKAKGKRRDGPIAAYNASVDLVDLLRECGYAAKPGSTEHFRSPQQTSATYATRIYPAEARWVSLSGSDIAAGLGSPAGNACSGDAFDILTFYKFKNDAKAALASLPKDAAPPLVVHDVGDIDLETIPPRQWLLGVIFCLTFLSSLIGAGASGKTALRIAQALALATGRELTGERVFRRCRVLYLSLEDNFDEARRRLKAAMIFHKVKQEEVKGWLFISTPKGLRLAEASRFGAPEIGPLHSALIAEIEIIKPDLIIFDPFIKSHGLGENDNNALDYVAALLVELADKYGFAVDAPHHERKGLAREAGDADRGRGASSFKDAGRLVYTLTPMTEEEAKLFAVTAEQRRLLFRVDSAKVNIVPPSTKAVWFRLVGVKLGNVAPDYPSGDEVQTVERWYPPDVWQALDAETAMAVLQDIERGLSTGQRYSSMPQAAPERQAWQVVKAHCPVLADGQCQQVVKTWLANAVVAEEPYHDPVKRKRRLGLFVKQWLGVRE